MNEVKSKTNAEHSQIVQAMLQQLATQPDNAPFLLELGSAYYELKQYDDALVVFNKVINLYPDNADAYYQLGLCQKALNNNADAFHSFSKCINLDSTHAFAYFHRAHVRLRGEREKIAEDLDKAIELKSDCADFYRAMAEKCGEFLSPNIKSFEAFHKLIELEGYDVDLHAKLIGRASLDSIFFVNEGEELLMLKELDMIIQHKPNIAKYYAYRASVRTDFIRRQLDTCECVDSQEDRKCTMQHEIVSDMQIAVKLDPDNLKYQKKYAYSLYFAGQYVAAERKYTEIMPLLSDPENTEEWCACLYNRARVLNRLHRYDDALSDLYTLLTTPSDANAYAYLVDPDSGCYDGRITIWNDIIDILMDQNMWAKAHNSVIEAFTMLEWEPMEILKKQLIIMRHLDMAEACQSLERKISTIEAASEAVTKIRKAHQVWDDDVTVYEDVPDMSEAELQRALHTYEAFIEYRPELSRNLVELRIKVAQISGQKERALDEAKKMLIMNPRSALASRVCLEHYRAKKLFEKALLYLDNCEYSSLRHAWLKSVILIDMNKADEALEGWFAYLESDVDKHFKIKERTALLHSAVLYYRANRRKDSMQCVYKLKALPAGDIRDYFGYQATIEVIDQAKNADVEKVSPIVTLATHVDPEFWINTMAVLLELPQKYTNSFIEYIDSITQQMPSDDITNYKAEKMHTRVFSNFGDIPFEDFLKILRSSNSSIKHFAINVEVTDAILNKRVLDAEETDSQSIYMMRYLNRQMRARLISEFAKAEREKADMRVAHEKALADARVEERNKVIQDMSHSIKNLVASVVEPLNDLAVKYTDDRVVIQKALRGAELIRGTVNALNLSFRGCPEDFAADARGATGSDHAVSMEHLLILSLESAVSNMFDGKYFADFCHAYFPTRDAFMEAKKAWENVQKEAELVKLGEFMSTYMLDLKIDDKIGLNALFLDDAHNSPLKLTILFQEMLLNAVKYACFAPRNDRFVRLSAKKSDGNIVLRIENAFLPGKSARTTRVGNEIVKNIVKLMGGTVETHPMDDHNAYEAVLTFPNIFDGKY